MMRRKRKLWIILVTIPLLVVGAGSLYWYIAARNLEFGFAEWLAAQRIAGWTATTGTPVRGGWPFAATLTVPTIVLKGGDPELPGGLNWSADRVVLRVSLFRPQVLELAPEGTQHLRVAGGPDIALTAARLRAALPLQPPPSSSWLTITSNNLRVALPIGTDPQSTVAIGHLDLRADFNPAAASGTPAVAVTLRAGAIDAPPRVARLLGPRITSVSLDGAIDGPLPAARSLAERAAAWRDGGGTVEIQKLALTWGPLDLSAAVTLALDDDLQPMGAGSAHVVGYAETLDALATRGAMSRSAATAAKAVLSLLEHAPEDGSPSDVDVPLTLQYRTLAMRQVPLLRLPELAWP